MSEIALLPDMDIAMLDLLEAFALDGVSAANIRTTAPTPGKAAELPGIQAYTYDGTADQLEGESVFDVHCFASGYAAASLLARTVDARLMRYPHRVGSVIFDRVETVSSPTEVEFVDDNTIRRFTATYTVSFRRR